MQEISPELREKALSLKTNIETKLGESFDQFEPTHYTQQVVAGMIYHFRILVSDGEALFVRVFEPLPYTGDPMEVTRVQKVDSNQDLTVIS